MNLPGGLPEERVRRLVGGFAGQHVVVVGDMVADEYVFGTPRRISREAPVVVLEFVRRLLVPGGATNVAVNLRALGAAVSVVGIIGADETGRELRSSLDDMGISTQGMIVDADRPTTTATRIIGGGVQVVQQQIVRIDRMVSHPVTGHCKQRLLDAATAIVPSATGLILSDYEHGVIEPELSALCLQLSRRNGSISTVDAHGDLFRFQGMTLATPNQPEAEATVGRALEDTGDLRAACDELLVGMRAEGVLITRGSQGMVALDRQGRFSELPALNMAEVRDATGAGDTVAAAATLVLGAGGSLAEAAVVGNVAASQVVRHFGAATISTPDLLDALRRLAAS